MASFITTGIEVRAVVDRAKRELQMFGQAVRDAERDIDSLSSHSSKWERNMGRLGLDLGQTFSHNWRKQYRKAFDEFGNANVQMLQRLENEYDRAFRNLGNKYQSMIMGAVALSMSGVSFMNVGRSTLTGLKSTLDYARDWEVVEQQIAFYSGLVTKDLETQQKEIKKISNEIFKIGRELPVLTTDIGEGTIEAFKLGYETTEEAIKMSEEGAKLQFMSLQQLSGDDSLKFLNLLRKQTGFAVEEIDVLTDKIIKTADVSAASPDSLFSTLMSTRTAFDGLQTDVDTFMTLMGVMSDRLQPKRAGDALSAFSRGISMAEKAGMENRGTRGQYYNELVQAMGKSYDDYDGDVIAYLQDVTTKSRELWGDGMERTGKLTSIFSKSALDLFYAVDAYNEMSGRTMNEMRDAIQDSDGHAQKYIELLMNTSYGTEQKLATMWEQFQILFGQTIRPAFNTLIDGITRVLTKVNEFIQEHPKIAKVLGYGIGLTGLLSVAAGGALLFAGAILAIVSSMKNFRVQMARNTGLLGVMTKGFNTAGEAVKAQLLGPFGSLRKSFFKLAGITLFLSMAWKNDFLRIRTNFTAWYEALSGGLKRTKDMFEIYANGTLEEWKVAFGELEKDDTLEGTFTKWLTKARIFWEGVKDILSDNPDIAGRYDLEGDTFERLEAAGLIPMIEKVAEFHFAVTEFWDGFVTGVGQGLEVIKTTLAPLIEGLQRAKDFVIDIFQFFGFFEDADKGVTSDWEGIGKAIGTTLGLVIAIRGTLWAWNKALRTALGLASRFISLLTFGRGFGGFGRGKNGPWFGGGRGGKGGRKGGKRGIFRRVLVPSSVDKSYRKGSKTFKNYRDLRQNPRRAVVDWGTGQPRGAYGHGPYPPASVKGRGPIGKAKDFLFGRRKVYQGGVYSKDGKVYTSKDGRRYIRTQAGGTRFLGQGDTGRTNRGLIGRFQHARGSKRGFQGFPVLSNPFTKDNLKKFGKATAKGGLKFGKGMAKTTWKVGKGIVKKVPGLSLLFGGAQAVSGWKNAGEKFGLALGEEATLGQKTSSAIGGVLDGLTFGLINDEWATKTIYNVGKKIGDVGSKAVKGLGKAWEWLTGKSKDEAGKMSENLKEKLDLRKEFNLFVDTMKNKVPELFQKFREESEVFDSIMTKFESLYNGLVNRIKSNPVIMRIKPQFENLASGVKNVVNKGTSLLPQSVRDLGSRLFSHKTGLDYVPKDNYFARLHYGERVLTSQENMLLNSLIGNRSVSEGLLELKKKASQKKLEVKPQATVQTTASSSPASGGKIEMHNNFNVQINLKDASQDEIKRGARELFEEFKRLVELENMRHYRPARPRRA